jgi:hypothetical protein
MMMSTKRVAHAATAGGYELPVIDVTHPAFKVDGSPEAVENIRRAFAVEEAQRKRMPKWLFRFVVFLAARRSLLMRALVKPESPVLDGLNTYVFKLGAKNLPPRFDNEFDRRMLASASGRAMSLRVQQMAELLAEGIRAPLQNRPDAPVCLLNIGGGSAIDSLNALILLRSENPQLLARRKIIIHVLDPDGRAPFFGRNALAALSAEDQPLAGLGVDFVHEPYDWNDTRPLEQRVAALIEQSMIVGASSEGALFEYGSDEAIVANLKALYARGAGAEAVAGSVTRSDPLTRATMALSLFKLIPRGVEGFSALIRETGYAVTQVKPGLMGDQVLLQKQPLP